MTYVGDIAHIAYFIADVLQITKQQIERDSRTSVAQVAVAIYGRSAYVHTYMTRMVRYELFLLAVERIINRKFL